jgi:flagellar hook-associated protein 1 FlgK
LHWRRVEQHLQRKRSGLLKSATGHSSLVFNTGTDVANPQSSLKEHQALLTHLQNLKPSISGVSIDDETVSILQFQRSYQVSARLIQTVDQLLQAALAMGVTTTGA